MSGRSAYVRKKITETKGAAPPRGRARSTTSSERDDVTISDFPLPNGGKAGITGVGTTNARFLKFSEPVLRDADNSPYLNPPGSSSNSQSGGSTDGTGSHRRGYGDGYTAQGNNSHSGPLDEWAYARARRPAIRMEDVSGIEKSGFRSALDKKSEEMRRGLAKTFTFGKKKKDTGKQPLAPGIEFRPESSATVRPIPGGHGFSPEDEYGDNEYMGADAQGEPWDHGQSSHSQAQRHRQERRQQQQQQAFNNSEPWELANNVVSPPPSAKLPPIPAAAKAPQIKRWSGNGKPVQRWNKLRKDPELWDPNGDVLIYLTHKGAKPRPNASFRLSSHIIEATESRYLITMLREGSTEDSDAFGSGLPPSPVGAPPMLGSRHARGGGGMPTPPISEDNNHGNSLGLPDQDGQISYEMYFPPPANVTTHDQVRYHVTTRNVFALLYHASLVGISLHQALTDLHQRLDQYLPVASDPLGTLLHYMTARGLDDVRNDPDAAAALLAWSETPDVRWDEGWREAFCHAAGMHGVRIENAADFRHVTPVTRHLLERASLETQLRIQAAEERLATFDYADMWPPALIAQANSARASADRLESFLNQFYSRAYGSWPPPPTSLGSSVDGPTSPVSPGGSAAGDEEAWLSRRIVQRLQSDFAALYDYLVNRDVVFDGSETRSSRKWMMVSRSNRNLPTDSDTPDLPLTDMLVEWDNRFRFPHIPSPMPLVPESIPPVAQPPGTSSGGSGKTKKDKSAASGNNSKPNNSLERRIQFAYNEATNIDALSSSSIYPPTGTQSLVDEFIKFEKRDKLLEVDPSIARRGRWVLIYGVLQTLASVSVDAPAVRYRDGVSYHLSLRLRGQRVPPWRHHHHSSKSSPRSDELLEASHELSHCWTVPETWDAGTGETDDSDLYDRDRGYGPAPGTTRLHRAGSVARSQASSNGGGFGGFGSTASRGGGAASRAGGARSINTAATGGGGPQSHLSIMSGSVVSSTYSDSETASSIRTPLTPFSGPVRGRDGRQGGGNHVFNHPSQYPPSMRGGGYGMAYSGGPGRVDEEWDDEDMMQQQQQQQQQQQRQIGGRGGLLPLQLPDRLKMSSSHSRLGNGGGNGAGAGGPGMAVGDDYPTRISSQRESMVIGSAVGMPPRHLPTKQDSNMNETGLLIRDFDELDVIDDHDP